jgi:hypothetical protein
LPKRNRIGLGQPAEASQLINSLANVEPMKSGNT